MKFSIGYFDEDEYERPFADCVADMENVVEEVYFPWPGLKTCRSSEKIEDSKARLICGLKMAKWAGMKLCLLVNANCYGATSLSGAFEQKLLRAYQELDALGLAPDAVTTTSLYVADVLKRFVPGAERRASINMRLGTYWQMEKLFDLFDGFYLMREYNYNLLHIAKLRRDLDAVGKKLYLLANSGCMSYCPGQTFHDNLVAHEDEVGQAGNPSGFVPYVCWRHYQKKENHADLLKNTWIRPEDLWRYEGLFSCVKLATRKHQRPMRVISAYAHGKYNGNPLELTEPSHSALLLPGTLSNRDFPPDWFEQKAACNRQCAQCNYCESVWHMVYKDRSAQDL